VLAKTRCNAGTTITPVTFAISGTVRTTRRVLVVDLDQGVVAQVGEPETVSGRVKVGVVEPAVGPW